MILAGVILSDTLELEFNVYQCMYLACRCIKNLRIRPVG